MSGVMVVVVVPGVDQAEFVARSVAGGVGESGGMAHIG